MVSKDKPIKKHSILNRRASFDYFLDKEIVAGLVLNGREVRAARDGHIQLKGSYVTIKDNELWLNNASFSVKLNEKGGSDRTVDSSPRKLLASRKQIDGFISQKKAGYSIIPTKLINNGHFIKIAIALGKGKKIYDKREVIKKRQQEREVRQEI